MSLPPVIKKPKPINDYDSSYVNETKFVDSVNKDFYGWVAQKSKETGKSREDVVDMIFKNGFITYEETVNITESVNSGAGQPSIVSAWNSPIQTDGVDEYRRLRKHFAPISKAIDYLI